MYIYMCGYTLYFLPWGPNVSKLWWGNNLTLTIDFILRVTAFLSFMTYNKKQNNLWKLLRDKMYSKQAKKKTELSFYKPSTSKKECLRTQK